MFMPLEDNDSPNGKYGLAMTLVFFIPGSVLAILSRLQPTLLPRSIVEFLFPLTILPVEKQLIVALYNQSTSATKAGINPIIFDRLDFFGQQVFVIMLLCFFLSIAIYCLQVRAGALCAEPTLELMPILMVLIVASVVARLFFTYMLVANMDSVASNLPSKIAVSHLMNAIAPEGLIMFSCLTATSLAQISLFIYRTLCERLF
jgi:hypothetical protein